MRKRSGLVWLAAAAALVQCALVHAAVYKCIGPDSSPTYSDKACDPKPASPAAPTAPNPGGSLGAARDVPVVAPEPVTPASSVDRKLHELLLLTGVSAREAPGLAEVARTLVPRVDPELTDMSQDPRWAALSRAIQADIRADIPQLGRAYADADQALLQALGSRMREADTDALLSFLRSPTGVAYLQFLGDMRAVYASAVRSVLGHVAAQTPISQSSAGTGLTNTRVRLVTLAFGAASLYRAQDMAHGVHDPVPYAADGILPVQITAVVAPGLDAIAARYQTALPEFESFDAAASTRLFFSSVERPVAAKMIATQAAMRDFGNAEFEKYGARWKAAYRRGVYYVAVVPGVDSESSAGFGPTPQIRSASYVSSRGGRALDVTHVLQSACRSSTGACTVACGNQLAGDPDFGHVKYCQITFQCGNRAVQSVRETEGRTLTLACGP
ncbi:MAG: hypothetical protein JO184_02075 [Gammaproteobacteria bacterium]|nr:hypothetical protein [Gammaproteobacteria bacterium]MBV8307064.1 hypothetical protein [Gammaproteobacteria bacterium]